MGASRSNGAKDGAEPGEKMGRCYKAMKLEHEFKV